MIELLCVADCPSATPTEALLRCILAEERCSIPLRKIIVETPQQATTLRFLGSPTIRVNGRDIEAARADELGGAMSCRLYQTELGSAGIPPAALIRGAVRRLMCGDADPFGSGKGSTEQPDVETTQ
jgi:hypothetical protein